MRDTDRADFCGALLELAKLKRAHKDLDDDAYEAWWRAMREWSLPDFKAACAQLRDRMEFMPNPFHFNELRRAALPTAAELWARARAHAKALPHWRGHPQEQPSGDPVLDAAVLGIGGYVAIAMHKTDELHFLERRFSDHLEACSATLETRMALPGVIASAVKQLARDKKPSVTRDVTRG